MIRMTGHPHRSFRPPRSENMNEALRRNIAALAERRQAEQRALSGQARLVQAITAFAGSVTFVYVHLVFYGGWIAINLGIVPHLPVFDPGFTILATEASIEAIFLSTFVLISQNHTAAVTEKHSDLDLQISLLTEHELTKLIRVVSAIADHLGMPSVVDDHDLADTQEDVAPEAVLDEIEAKKVQD